MLETILARGRTLAEARRTKCIAQIIAAAPPGVDARPSADGVTLSGRRLRWRFIRDAALRNFWR